MTVVSVVICTRNRAQVVADAIRSLVSPKRPDTLFEIVVVDNGSVDETAAVVRSLNVTGLRYVAEDALGLSRARNTGWQAAQGQIVAFLDDDAIACPGWVDAIASGLAQDDGAAALGGPVQPIWHAPRPFWLTDEIAHALTILDWGPMCHRIDTGRQWLVGANMAFRRELLEACGGFDTRLGRQGELLLSNEETFLLRQIEQLGHAVLYWPAMQVEHPVPAARLDPRWLIQRHFWQGRSDARVWLMTNPSGGLSGHLLQSVKALQPPEPEDRGLDGAGFTQQCRAARRAGYITELLGGAET